MREKLFFSVIFVVLAFSYAAANDERAYYPRNPSFGGHPSYGSHLLNLANAQNEYKEPEESLKEKTLDALESAYLSAIRSAARDAYLGDRGDEYEEVTKIEMEGITVEIDASNPDDIKYSVY